MTQFYADADNGLDVGRDGLAITSTTHTITSSSVANPTNILCTGHGLISTDETIIAGHSGSTPDINGTHVATRIDDDNFTIPVNVTTGGTGGTSTDNDGPWKTMNKFSEAVRSAGDILTCRRGTTATYDDGGQLAFTSDGTVISPITIEGDFDDAWSDDVTADQTYTMVFGSKVHTASATITTLAAEEVIYVVGDDQRLFAYEVASVATDKMTLKLPFKGTTGAGKSLTVMLANPVWGATSGFAFKVNLSSDVCWRFQGLNISSTNATNFSVNSLGVFIMVLDCILLSDTTSSHQAFTFASDDGNIIVNKCRTSVGRIMAVSGEQGVTVNFQDCLLIGTNNASSWGVGIDTGVRATFEDCEFTDFSAGNIAAHLTAGQGNAYGFFRNCVFTNNDITDFDATTPTWCQILMEDHNGVLNATRQYLQPFATTDNTHITESDTGTVRSGGSNISTKITPTTNFASDWEFSRLKLLDEYPIFLPASAQTIDIYFKTANTTDWTADPTAAELWIEVSYWAHASNNFRGLIKSTGTIDFNGSTLWQKLTVAFTPAQAGVAYLTCWYGKTKESGKTNIFWVDTLPVVA